MIKTPITERWVVVGDTQCPFHDPAAVSVAQQLIGYIKPDHLIYDGDMCDMYSLSKHERKRYEILNYVSLQEEIDITIAVQDFLSSGSKKTKRHQIDGNHEERLERWLGSGSAASLGDLKGLRVEEVFHYKERGFSSYHPYGDGIWITDNLFVTHGSHVDAAPGGSVKKHIAEINESVIIGHVHRRAHIRFRAGKHELAGVENGCLCQIKSGYKPHTNWTHCITLVEVIDNKHFRLEVIDIITDEEMGIRYADYKGNRFSETIDYDDGLTIPWWVDRAIDFESIS